MADDGHLRDPAGAGKAGVKPGERLGGRGRVTLQIIADRLDVSTATVSLALRDSPLVADGTRLRVQQIAREMGYSYNRSAASLRTDRTNILGVGFHDITNPISPSSWRRSRRRPPRMAARSCSAPMPRISSARTASSIR